MKRRWALSALLCAVAAPALAAEAAPARAAAPSIEATWVTDVTATSATLRARIDPNGLPSTYRFEYVTLAAWEASGFNGAAFAPSSGAAGLGSGSEPISVFQHLSSLQPTTTYRYRVRATNGTVALGPERSLTTGVASNVFKLPDGRAWEMVSPIDKGGGAIAAPESLFGGGDFQAAADGASLTYTSPVSFAGGAGNPGAGQYVSSRGASGWSTQNVTTPAVSGSYGDEPDGVPYRVFAGDLSAALLSNGVRCRDTGTSCPVANPPLPGSGAPAGYRNYYLRSSGGSFQALLTAADAPSLALAADEFELALSGATPDLANVVVSTCAKLTTDATEVPAAGGCNEGEQNLYEWSGGALRLLNVLPAQRNGTPGAVLAAPTGAISADGQRVYFTMLEDGALYLSEAGGETKLVPETAGGGAAFQVASTGGQIAYFTRAGMLYRYDAVAQTSTPIGSGVSGVLGASADGAYIYFQDGAGLQQWHDGATTQIAPGAGATIPADRPPATGVARVSADGEHLAFLSDAELTGYDNTDADEGAPDTELYLYGPPPGGSAPQLVCASCNPTGERPRGSASIPGAVANGSTVLYRPRVLSAGGNRVFFDSADRLVSADTDSLPDVYEWEADGVGDCSHSPGCVGLVSGGRGEGGRFLDASADGSDAFFLTGESLVGADPGSIDVYDAREGGGFPEPEPPFVCTGDACQALPAPPEDPTPGTLVPTSGNPPLKIERPKHKHHRCRKGKVRRHGRCVKQ